MRRVEFCKTGYYGGKEKSVPSNFEQGVLHGFYSEGDTENGLECYGLVEIGDGTLKMIQTHKMKFILEPPKSEQGDSKNSSQAVQQLKAAISLLEEVADTSSTEYAAHAQLMSFKKRAMEIIAKQHHA